MLGSHVYFGLISPNTNGLACPLFVRPLLNLQKSWSRELNAYRT